MRPRIKIKCACECGKLRWKYDRRGRLREYINHHYVRAAWSLWRKRIRPGGDKHPNWKGDEAGYNALHAWVNLKLGSPQKCENKECKYPRNNQNGKLMLKPKRYDWANISRKYFRKLSDWMRLCRSCHKKFDCGTIKL